MRRISQITVWFLLPSIAGCTVGPDYHGAPHVAPTSEIAQAFRHATSSTVNDEPQGAGWWEELNDPTLNKLVEKSLRDSPNVYAAEARLRQARSVAQQQRANQYPSANATGLYLRTKLPSFPGSAQGTTAPTLPSDLNLYSVGFDATWELDLFGGTRRALESASAKAEASEADLEDLQVSLAAEVVQDYVQLRALQQKLALSQEDANLVENVLALTEQRHARGVASAADIERLKTELEQTRGGALPLVAQIDAKMGELALLSGQEPGLLDEELSVLAGVPSVPSSISVGDPASLLRRRPDIRKAERNLAATNAQIGQQIAGYFPKVNLIGSLGYGGTDVGHLFDGSPMPLAAPFIQWNFLDFGRTSAKVDQAHAANDEALANYRQVVLNALNEAESSLSQYGHQREYTNNLARVVESANRTLALTEQRNKAGAASQIEVLNDLRNQASARQNFVEGLSQLTVDFAAVQKSLGLGWRAKH